MALVSTVLQIVLPVFTMIPVAYSFFAWDHNVEGAPKRDIRADPSPDSVRLG